MSQIFVNQINPASPGVAINFTGSLPPTFNGTPFGTGGGGGSGGPASGYVDPRPIRSTPPAPTGLTATGAFKTVILSWNLENYINHAYVEVYRSDVNNRASSTLVGTTTANVFNDPNVTVGETYYYWIRAVNIETASGPFNSADLAGTSASLLKIGNVDLGSLVVEAANLANGAIDATKLAANAINSYTQFASGLEPIVVVSALPNPAGYTGAKIVLLTTDGKIYKYSGGAWVPAVAAADLSGTISDSQIGGLNANKLTGTLDVARIAANALDSTKFATSIQPITMVSSVPTVKSTDTIFNTTDRRLYYWNGTAYVKTLPAADIAGTLTSAQIADLDAAKLTGTINVNRIANGALTATKFASNIEPITVVSSVPTVKSTNSIFNTTDQKLYTWNTTSGTYVTPSFTPVIGPGEITSTMIADGSISTPKLLAGTINANVLAVGSITSNLITANSLNGDRIAVNTLDAGKITSGTITATQIAASAISVDKLIVTGRGSALNDDPSMADDAAWPGTSGINPPVRIKGATDGIAGVNYIRLSGASSGITSREFSPAEGKVYRTSFYARRVSGSGTCTAFLRFRTADNLTTIQTAITSTSSSHTGTMGAMTIANTWTRYTAISTAPPNAARAVLIFVANNATGTAVIDIQDFRVDEYIGADLIVDGAITSEKMTANSINGDRIVANSLAASKIVSGSITTDKFTTNTIGGSILQNGTITADKLVANSITAGQIAAGAISAEEIAAGAITASKLIVSDNNNIFPDPTWSDRTFWTGGSTISSAIVGETNVSWPCRSALRFNGPTGSFIFNSGTWKIELGATYRTRVYLWLSADFAGDLGIAVRYPQQEFNSMGVPVSGIIGTTPRFNTASIPKGSWQQYVAVFTNSNTLLSTTDPNTVSRLRVEGNITAGTAYFTVEIVRAMNADLIVDGAITTQKMTANSINGDRIAANTLNADRIVSNSITSGKIAAGAITADQIAANAVTTSKLTVVDFTNLAENANFEAGNAGWDLSPNWTIVSNPSEALSGSWVASSTSTPGTIRNVLRVPVKAGDQFYAEARIKRVGTTGGPYVQIEGFNSAGTAVQFADGNAVTTSTYSTSSTSIIVDPAVVSLRVRVYTNATCFVDNVVLRRKNGGELIVDGAITTTKIAANTITAGSGIIQNGAITNALIANLAVDDAKIANATITAAKIGSVNANTITTGTLSADRIAAGSITAAKINSNGLTIRDSSGNIILNATTGTLDWTKLINQPSNIFNSNITLNHAAGVISLGGAGSGSVTAVTTTNPITEGNINTYISGTAIGLAKINTATITNLQALSAEMGNLVISTSGSIRSGQTAYNTGTGWWLGIDAGTPKFSIGNPAGSYMRWTGTELEFNGSFAPFTAAITGGGAILSLGNGLRTYVTRTVTLTGGKAPFTYTWSQSFTTQNGTPVQIFLTNSTTASCTISGSANNEVVYLSVKCTILDANGRTTSASIPIEATHGTPPPPP